MQGNLIITILVHLLNGWKDSKTPHNIPLRAIFAKAASVNQDVKSFNEKVPSSFHDLRDIYNAGEIKLFFRLLPDKTFALKGE